MGAERDREFFALEDASRYGNHSGHRDQLATDAHALGVDPEVLDGLGHELNLVDRAARLRMVAESAGELAAKTEDALEVLANGNIADVAAYLVGEQLPESSADSESQYLGATYVYRFTSDDDGRVIVQTGVYGGGMGGPFTYEESFPITAEWVEARIAQAGVERETEFCAFVAAGIGEVLVAAEAEVANG